MNDFTSIDITNQTNARATITYEIPYNLTKANIAYDTAEVIMLNTTNFTLPEGTDEGAHLRYGMITSVILRWGRIL